MAETKPKNIHQRIAAITGEVGGVKKTGKNAEQKYDFIEYDAVTAALRVLMEKHGITILQDTKEDGRHDTQITSKYGAKGVHVLIDYIFTVTNVDDPSDNLKFNWQGEAIDYGDKATNKAATAAEKYFLLKFFKIGSKDDPDKDSPDLGKATVSTPAKQAQETKPSTSADDEGDVNAPDSCSTSQRSTIFGLLNKDGIDKDNMPTVLTVQYGVVDPQHMTYAEAKRVIDTLIKGDK
jgi:hypothetical protein